MKYITYMYEKLRIRKTRRNTKGYGVYVAEWKECKSVLVGNHTLLKVLKQKMV